MCVECMGVCVCVCACTREKIHETCGQNKSSQLRECWPSAKDLKALKVELLFLLACMGVRVFV